MSTVQVNLKDFANALREYKDRSVEDFKRGITSGVAKSIPDLVKASPVDTGLYAQSWYFNVTEEAAVIGNYAPHAPIIEFGARPFTPPIKPLLEWAKRVLKDPSQPPSYSSAVWRLAKGTQNKISEYGIQPRHVLQNMLPTIIENIREEMRRV